jgi:hypothetical protein
MEPKDYAAKVYGCPSDISIRLIPDSGVVFSSTIVLGPKARDSKAQANGLGL